MKKVVLPVIFSALIAGCLAMIGGSNVYAYPSPAELIKKAYDNGVEKCSNDQYFKKNVSLYDVYGLESITNGGGIGTIKNPNPLEDVLSTSGIDCKTLFANHIKVSVPEYSSGNNQAINAALINLGYNGNGATSGGKTCIDISYKNANNTNGKSQPLCITSDSNGALNTEEVANANGSFDTSKYDVGIYLGHCGDPLGPASVCLAWKESSGYTQVESIGNRTTPYTTLAEIQADIEKAANRLSMATQTGASDIGLFSNVTVNSPTTERGDGSYESYTYGSNPETNAGLILENFSNYSSWPAAAFTPYEKYWYYMYTLLDFYKVSIDEQSCDTVKSSSNPRAIPMHNQNGGRRWCNVTGARENGDMLVNMFSDDHFLDKEGGLDDVIAAIRSLDINSDFPDEELASISETTGEVTDPDPDQSDDTGGSADATDACYGAKGTLGMSWILCPALTGLSNFLNGVYTWIQDDYIAIEPSMFSTDNETYSAWQKFQGFANIIFVILLLVVIFSQLTGIGIDNYGIKKILPRLIVVAILINLSYFIAQFFVDISNIIGKSLSGIFGTVNIDELGGYARTDIPEKILGLSLTAGGVAGAAAFLANPALALSLLLTLLSGAISVLVMWAILVARKAGVVIAVVIAPLAFAAYLLPNTSKFTKTWVNLMKALLLLFPLAALLISACFFASDLIAAQNEGMILAAMLLRVVPFLALPALFKKSLDVMGSLGTKIQGFGRTLSRGATGAVRGSNAYKNAQQLGTERSQRLRAGYNADGSERNGFFARTRRRLDDSTVGRRLGWQRTRRNATDAYLRAQNELKRDEYMSNRDNVTATLIGQEAKWEKEQVENQSVLLDKGMMASIDGGALADSDNPRRIREELTRRLSQPQEYQKEHYAENAALWKKLQSFKDKGYDETAKLWDDANITDSNSRLMQEIKADVAANGDFKNGARTAYDIITSKVPRAAGAIKIARSAGGSLNNLKMERLPDFSGAELKALSEVAQGEQYDDGSGTLQTPSAAAQLQASELLYNALSDPQVARRFKGADADVARAGSRLAFEANFDKMNHGKDDNVSYVKRDENGNIVNRLDYKRTQNGFIYNPITKKMVDESSLINKDKYERVQV